MQTSRPNGDNYLWRCVALSKGTLSILGLRDFLQRKKVPDKKGELIPTFLPALLPPPSSPGKKSALKMRLPRVTTYSSSYKPQEQLCLLVQSRGCKKGSFLISSALIFRKGTEPQAWTIVFVPRPPEVHCNLQTHKGEARCPGRQFGVLTQDGASGLADRPSGKRTPAAHTCHSRNPSD